MRTGSPFGGGVGVAGSPSNDLIVKPTGMPNDVEAAIAMVGLSGGFGSNGISSGIVQKSAGFESIKVEPTDFDDVSKNYESLSRSVHIKCPVMPERHSFVQKALKRKIFENRSDVVVSRERTDDRMTSNTNSVDKRTTSEDQDEFIMAKRIRLETEVDHRQYQVGGRFVRTCQPCQPDDLLHRSQQRQIELRQQPFGRLAETRKLTSRVDDSSRESSHQNVGRFVRTGQPCLSGDVWKSFQPTTIRENVKFNESGSPVFIPLMKTSGVEKAPMLQSPDSKYAANERYHPSTQEMPLVVSSPPRQSKGWLPQMPKTYQGPKIQPFSKQRTDFIRIPSGSPSGGTMSSTIVKQNIPLNHSIGRQDMEQTDRVFSHQGMKPHVTLDQQSRKTDNLNAMYSLGRYAAASACVPSLRRQELPHISDFTNSSVESRKLLYSPSKQRLCSVFSQDIHFQNGRTNENCAVKLVQVSSLDVRTERKVTNGEFGSLRSLRQFYNKLDKKPTGPRQPLSSITNRNSAKHEEYDDSWQYNDNSEETALDLSMHSNRVAVNFGNDVTRSGPSQIMRRKSRSCCSSPAPNVTMLRRGTRETSTEYIDRLLLLESGSDLFHPDQAKSSDNASSLPSSPFASQKVEDDVQSPKSSPSKPNNMLPLKKRRLVEIDSSDRDSPVNSSRSPSSVASGAQVQEENDVTTYRIDNIPSRSQYFASAITQPDEDGNLPLHVAAAHGKLRLVNEVIKMMSAIGASLDVRNNFKQTALHLAVQFDQPDVVRSLLEAGASPNVDDQDGLTSVHYASKLRSAACLCCLVEYSTVPLDVNAITDQGLSALHLAVVGSRNPSTVATLISAGAFVDIRDQTNGRTPLYYAVERNDIQLATILLQRGADPSKLASSSASVTIGTRCSTEVARLLNAYTNTDDRSLATVVLPAVCLS